jgi:hypothetical protein
MPLPYPGYTWQFTQHAVGLAPGNLIGLLKAATRFEGKVNPGAQINRFLADLGILTRNIRQGKSERWRDYQQILSELGLLYSTKIQRPVTPTPIAFALLDGLLGYSEVLTTQALRYQYPNGLKHNLIKRQIETGVLIKPAVLILKTLFALTDLDPREAFLTDQEIQTFLISVYNVGQPRPDPRLIIRNRVQSQNLPQHGVRRNVQDWLKLLWHTDLFTKYRKGAVAPSKVALSNRERVEALLTYHDSAESFWIPTDDSAESRMSWFAHFGSVNLASQWVLLERDLSSEYQSDNYLEGRDDVAEISATEDEALATQFRGIGGQLREPIPRIPGDEGRLIDFAPPTAAELEERYTKSEKNRNLHAKIVAELAVLFRQGGAQVYEDPNSIDLLVRMPEDGESIIEVKTVSPRNFKYRVRLGIGQLFEYQYRRQHEAKIAPTLALAISSEVRENDPVLDFLNRHLDISVLARREQGSYQSFRAARGTPLDLIH